MKYTANYNLKKPDYTDLADIADINTNMDTIDTKLKENADNLTSHTNTNASTLAKGHVQLSDSVSSTSISLAATANAVKKAYDKAKEAFQSASDGKTGIASVIGSPATSGDTFSTLQGHIQTAKNTMATNLTTKGVSATDTEALQSLAGKITNIEQGYPAQNVPALFSGSTDGDGRVYTRLKGMIRVMYHSNVMRIEKYDDNGTWLGHETITTITTNHKGNTPTPDFFISGVERIDPRGVKIVKYDYNGVLLMSKNRDISYNAYHTASSSYYVYQDARNKLRIRKISDDTLVLSKDFSSENDFKIYFVTDDACIVVERNYSSGAIVNYYYWSSVGGLKALNNMGSSVIDILTTFLPAARSFGWGK
jgi:hypothetical protein